ncbi:MAG: hypothetical protein CVV50_01400 [Spirochaetae bacterium HGW-Spirochaetae-6]|nr:MAG: hypothetical protein CVV50_01400 [Spirochaetae bacterium HGW-Spirochaetae-6]
MLSDQAARVLSLENAGKMTCLAAVGADLSGFIESAKAADSNIILDGCPVSCGKKIFERAGISDFKQYLMTDFGVEKGVTKITDEVVERVAQAIKSKILE